MKIEDKISEIDAKIEKLHEQRRTLASQLPTKIETRGDPIVRISD